MKSSSESMRAIFDGALLTLRWRDGHLFFTFTQPVTVSQSIAHFKQTNNFESPIKKRGLCLLLTAQSNVMITRHSFDLCAGGHTLTVRESKRGQHVTHSPYPKRFVYINQRLCQSRGCELRGKTKNTYVPLQTREHAWAGISGTLHFGGARGAFYVPRR